MRSPSNLSSSLYPRNKFGARFHHRNRNNSGPKLLAACLPGEQHRDGGLLFVLATHEQGYRLVLLGADMPCAGATRSQRIAESLKLTGTTH